VRLRLALAVLVAFPAALPAFPKLGDALIEAAGTDDQSAVADLLHQGADVNARAEDGTTPLALRPTTPTS
jgi:hypothetical protein